MIKIKETPQSVTLKKIAIESFTDCIRRIKIDIDKDLCKKSKLPKGYVIIGESKDMGTQILTQVGSYIDENEIEYINWTVTFISYFDIDNIFSNVMVFKNKKLAEYVRQDINDKSKSENWQIFTVSSFMKTYAQKINNKNTI